MWSFLLNKEIFYEEPSKSKEKEEEKRILTEKDFFLGLGLSKPEED